MKYVMPQNRISRDPFGEIIAIARIDQGLESYKMEPLDTIYAVLILMVVPLLVLALLVAAFLPREKRTEVLRKLRRLQF